MLTSLIALAIALQDGTPVAFTVDEKVVYRTIGKERLMMDIYRPAAVLKTVPLVIAIHGGAWMGGKREEMDPLCQLLVKEGIAVATIDYRLAPKSKWPAMLDDCEMAYTYLVKNAKTYSIDTNRIGVTGASAGGHLALLMATKPVDPALVKAGSVPSLKFRGVLNFFGPTDLTQDYDKGLQDLVSSALFGKKATEAQQEAHDLSPVNYVTSSTPPVFTIHGDADTTVPIKQAHRLDDALKGVHVQSVLKIIPGMNHGYFPSNPAFVLAVQDGISWLKKKLVSKG